MKTRYLSLLAVLIVCLFSIYYFNNQSKQPIRKGYFPCSTSKDRKFTVDKVDKFEYSWYSKALIALKEPSLYELSNNKKNRVYRFLYIRSFHPPISFRLEINKDNSGVLYVKQCGRSQSIDYGELVINKKKQIKREEVVKFLWKANLGFFWYLPSKLPLMGLDGSQWIVEGVEHGKYHFVDRWSPESGTTKSLGLFLLNLSDLEIDEKDIDEKDINGAMCAYFIRTGHFIWNY